MERVKFNNPILYMDFSDPDVICVEDDFFMISSSFTYLPGVPCLHSKDLIHWELISYCVKELPFERFDKPCHGCGTWAPAIRFYEGTYYCFIPLPDEGIFYTETENPFGEWSELKLVKEAKGWIDPCPFWDEDGKVYMVHAFAKSRCGIKSRLDICRLDIDSSDICDDGIMVYDGTTLDPTIEGPKLYKRNGYYYIFAPAGGVPTGWQTVLRSKNIYGPYERKVVLSQGNTNINGPHQGALVDDKEGNYWFVHFQDVGRMGRITHLQPVKWVDDWPLMGENQDALGCGEPVAFCEKSTNNCIKEWISHKEKRNCQAWINSDVKKLTPLNRNQIWQWQANPKAEFGYYDEDKNVCVLRCINNTNYRHLNNSDSDDLCNGDDLYLWHMPNLLTTIPNGETFVREVDYEFYPSENEDAIVFGMIGQEYCFVSIEYSSGDFIYKIVKGEGKAGTPLQEAAESVIFEKRLSKAGKCGSIRMRIENGKAVFDDMDEYELSFSQGRWVGAKICIGALNRRNIESEGYAIIK